MIRYIAYISFILNKNLYVLSFSKETVTSYIIENWQKFIYFFFGNV